MIIHDVNVLVYAYREETNRHEEFRQALEEQVLSPSAFGYSPLVLSGFLRVVTHPRIFELPTPIDDALDFVDAILEQPNAVELVPGARHWSIFRSLCQAVQTKGNLVPDAYHAALAIESGSEWITTDRDFSRFPGLRWRHPLD